VYSVDRVPQRLAKAKSLGAIPIDFSKGDPAAQILELEPNGVDRPCDCSGWESVNARGENFGNIVLIQAVAVTKIGGGIGLIGGLFPKIQASRNTPFPLTNAIINSLLGASTADAKKGIFKFPFGDFWEKESDYARRSRVHAQVPAESQETH
jgi:threonine dehydrogenase-like Zn-dependent dehydrogenase